MARRLALGMTAVMALSACCVSERQGSGELPQDLTAGHGAGQFDYFSFVVLVGCMPPVTRALMERVATEFSEVEMVVLAPPGMAAESFEQAGIQDGDLCKQLSRLSCGWYEDEQLYFIGEGAQIIGHFP